MDSGFSSRHDAAVLGGGVTAAGAGGHRKGGPLTSREPSRDRPAKSARVSGSYARPKMMVKASPEKQRSRRMISQPGIRLRVEPPVSIANCDVAMFPLPWAPEGDEGDGVAGRDCAADGLHGASTQEVGHGFPAIAGVVVE
jgi:hypothetical protein